MKRIFVLLFAIAFFPCAAESPHEVWLSAQPDGPIGKGTMREPFNATNPKRFDHYLNALPPGAVIHLAPGVYTTFGAKKMALKSGQHLLGSGMGKTIIKLLAPPKGASLAQALSNSSGTESAILVSDITVDCNYQTTWGKITVQGLALMGSNHTIQNVECINGAGFTQESFLICISGYTQDSRENLIEGCRVPSYFGGRLCTAISLVNCSTLADSQSLKASWTGGIVRNNLVDIGNGTVDSDIRIAFGGGGTGGALYTGNTAASSTYGFNYDTCRINEVTLTANVFHCSYTGINFRSNRPGDSIQNLTISDNIITLDPAADQVVAYGIVAGGGDRASAANIRIEGNTIRCATPDQASKCFGVRVFSITSLLLEKNSFAPRIANQILKGVQFLNASKDK